MNLPRNLTITSLEPHLRQSQDTTSEPHPPICIGGESEVGVFVVVFRPLKSWPCKPAQPNTKARRLARLLKHAFRVEGFACMSAVERRDDT
jgi:hypothetical protein